ncbi:hypothetical protein HY008_02945 [Candidatus Woesebacteria bacterium]|nr:hypothetical protein [Candidatus Woesebacteria bacterium]
MERDGITRIYRTVGFISACEVYPQNKPYEERLQGKALEEVSGRADYKCIGIDTGKKLEKKWSVYPKPRGMHFAIDIMGLQPEEEYSKLAQILEGKAGKKGLTIVLS